MSLKLFIVCVFSFFICCKSDTSIKIGKNEEVAFNIDSTLFNFNKIDTFLNVKMPHLKSWSSYFEENKSINPKIKLYHPDSIMYVEIENFKQRSPSSYKYYNDIYKNKNNQSKLLDISTYLKNDKKLIQVILKDTEYINFKLIEDLGGFSKEVNIFIPNINYTKSNINIVESIIGVINFF